MPCPKIADLQTCRFQRASDRTGFVAPNDLPPSDEEEEERRRCIIWKYGLGQGSNSANWVVGVMFNLLQHRRKAEPRPTGMLALTRRHDHAKSCWSFENLSTWHLIWRMRRRMCQKTLKLRSVTAHHWKAMQFLREVWRESYLLLQCWCHFTILYIDHTDMFFKCWLHIIIFMVSTKNETTPSKSCVGLVLYGLIALIRRRALLREHLCKV